MLSSINPVSHIRNYVIHTWNKQNGDIKQRIIQIANLLFAITAAGFATAGISGRLKVITSVCGTIISVVALAILNHSLFKQRKIEKITQCEFIVLKEDKIESRELVIDQNHQVRLTQEQYEILSENCAYFKKILNRKGVQKDENIDFARVVDNMNVLIKLSDLDGIENRDEKDKKIAELFEAWKVKLKVSKDSVALNLVAGKIQRGIDAVVENLYLATDCNGILVSFWEELLGRNVNFDFKNENLIKSLIKISQDLNLGVIPYYLFHFLLREKDHKAVVQLMNELNGHLTARELQSSTIKQFNLVLNQLDGSNVDPHESSPALNAILSKFTCEDLIIDSYIDIGVIENTHFLKNIKNFIITNEVTNRMLGRVIDVIVDSDKVERIDFSGNEYFDNGHSEHKAVLLANGFVLVDGEEKIFVKNK